MFCLACRSPGGLPLCSTCLGTLTAAPDRLLPGGLLVRSAFAHRGAARTIVHHCKYRGIDPAARFLAAAMSGLEFPEATLVPLPRAGWRRVEYGIDPARILVGGLARLTGLPTLDLLTTPWLSRSQAGRSRNRRHPPIFHVVQAPLGPVILVDDVITTGHTLLQARAALGDSVVMAITATSTG